MSDIAEYEHEEARIGVYLASRLSNGPTLRQYAPILESLGFWICSSWIFTDESGNGLTVERKSEIAQRDYSELMDADILLVFPCEGGSGGHHWESGAAYQAGKRVVVVGQSDDPFLYLPEHVSVETFEDAVKDLLGFKFRMEIARRAEVALEEKERADEEGRAPDYAAAQERAQPK